MSSAMPIAAQGSAELAGDAGIIDVRSVFKAFGATRALVDVTMSVGPGEVRGLVGRNGAGKSTLVSLLTGMLAPDKGQIRIAGRPATAGASGVACVYQHSRLVPALTVAENLMLGRYPRRRPRLVDWRQVVVDAERHLAAWELTHLSRITVEELDPVQAKVVEICRALTRNPRVLLLDEPTAGLDQRDAERLFATVDQLKVRGVTVVYVSHQLEEVYRLCDSASVLRNARHVVTAPLTQLPMRELVAAMVGGDAARQYTGYGQDPAASGRTTGDRRSAPESPVRLRAQDLSVPGKVHDFDIEVRGGECVGIAGIDGSGKAEIGAVLAGLLRPSGGTVTVDSSRVPLGNVRAALAAGISYIPPDRHAQGMVPQLSVSENTTITAARRLRRRLVPGLPLVVLSTDRDRVFRRLASKWEIVAASPKQLISELSGGNQQKCVMARGLATGPAVLVMHNPTAGIDVAARASIISTLDRVFADGSCGVVISEDPDDFVLCSRILVVVRGRLRACLQAGWTEGDLVAAMQGAER